MPVHLLVALCLAPFARASGLSDFPSLRDALAEGDSAAKTRSAFALGQFGLIDVSSGEAEPADLAMTRAAAAQALAGAESDPDPSVRRAATVGLGKVGGPDAESFLLAATTDIDPGVRGEAALALFRRRYRKRVVEYSTATVIRLAALSADAESEVRWRADYALGYWAEPRAAPVLRIAQLDSDWRARLFAVRGLTKLGEASDDALLADPQEYVRALAVASFAAAKAAQRLPEAIYRDPSPHVRAAAADATSDERRAPLLEQMLAGPGVLAPGRALVALARLQGAAAAPAVSRVARDPRWWMRARAVEAAALLPDASARLRVALLDSDPRVAAQAVETLAASTEPFTADFFEKALRDPSSPLEVRGAAIDAAGERADPALLDALVAAKAYAKGVGGAELREGLIAAFKAVSAKHVEASGRAAAALKNFSEFTDKPRRFKALKAAPSVVFETDRGTFTVALSPAPEAANHVAAFVDAVRHKFYDGLTWHRVVTAFVVQGGDPRGSGWGDAGWRLADEDTPEVFERGTVGMPKAGKDTGGCQLFVSLVPTPHLDGRYTAFGRVVAGIEVLDRLEPGDGILRAYLK